MTSFRENLISDLLTKAQNYCAAQKRVNKRLSLSTLGRIILNDSEYFERVEKTRNCTIRSYETVLDWLEEHKNTDKVNITYRD